MKTIRAVAGLLLLAGVSAGAQITGGMPGQGGMPGRGGMGRPVAGGASGVGRQGGMGRGGMSGGRRAGEQPRGRQRNDQGGTPPMAGQMGMGGAGGGLASMLLAHTGPLKLTDAQVSRLAAIARRGEDRHTAMRAGMDSIMRANRAQPGGMNGAAAGPRPMMNDQARAAMQRAHEQERADVRDALGVLTIDQQTDLWMQQHMRATHGPMGRGM